MFFHSFKGPILNAFSFGNLHISTSKKFLRLSLAIASNLRHSHKNNLGREHWSSGYGKRLMFRKLWVQTPAQYTGWAFFTFICCKFLTLFEKMKINEKETGEGLL